MFLTFSCEMCTWSGWCCYGRGQQGQSTKPECDTPDPRLDNPIVLSGTLSGLIIASLLLRQHLYPGHQTVKLGSQEEEECGVRNLLLSLLSLTLYLLQPVHCLVEVKHCCSGQHVDRRGERTVCEGPHFLNGIRRRVSRSLAGSRYWDPRVPDSTKR